MKQSTLSFVLFFLMIPLWGSAFSAKLEIGNQTGLSVAVYPFGMNLTDKYEDGFYWLGCGTSYQLLYQSGKDAFENFVSIYPVFGYSHLLGLGWLFSIEPLYNLNEGRFSQIRPRLEFTLIVLSLTGFCDIDLRTGTLGGGVSFGLSLPLPLNMIYE